MDRYTWKLMSQWDVPDKRYYTRRKHVKTGLSKEVCIYLLVKEIDMDGYIQTEPIDRNDVTTEMLKIAGDC